MVRKNAAVEARHVASSVGLSGHAATDSKSKRSKRSRSGSSFNMGGCLSVASAVLLVLVGGGYLLMKSYRPPKVQKYTPNQVRKRSQVRNLGAVDGEDDAVTTPKVAADFLPPNSVYNVNMENIRGELIHFDRFRGFVTLVVNVACL
jgi:hypothetical protein